MDTIVRQPLDREGQVQTEPAILDLPQISPTEEQSAPITVQVEPPQFSPAQVIIHGHFYQPPRENPFTGEVPREMGAEPYANFNEKITAECYRPNALIGNFEVVSFNLGPTLAAWIERHDPDTYDRIIASDRVNYDRLGFGNAIAQNYNHVILPLAKPEDARLQIEWGIMDFERRFGHRPEGMWLAETGASAWVLDLMAQAGLKFVILAPWQADASSVETINPADRAIMQSRLRQQIIDNWRATALQRLSSLSSSPEEAAVRLAEVVEHISHSLPSIPDRLPEPYEVTEPYLVELSEGRSIVAFFYNGKLSGDVSFNQDATADADRFAREWLRPELSREKLEKGQAQLLMIATDGELYGHHQAYRDHFLRHLARTSVPAAGMQMTFPSRYLREFPPRRRIRIHDNSSWSCFHGVARWSSGCYCTPGDSAWKGTLRQACDLLACEVDRLFDLHAGRLFKDPALALRDFLFTWQGLVPETEFLASHLRRARSDRDLALRLLRAQMYKHQMYTSCAWFFEDLDRIEPKNALAAAAIIFWLVGRRLRKGLRQDFEQLLARASSQRTGFNGSQLYRRGLRWAGRNGHLRRAPARRPVLGGTVDSQGREAVA
jgi:hypothetical protein